MSTIDAEKNIMTSTELSIAVIGHVDAGKSSLTGRILKDIGAIDPRTAAKLKEKAEQLHKSSFDLAFIMDTNPEEQNRGITIQTNSKQFFTPTKKRKITIVDAPGHKDFINNMITGTAQCNVAILVVSSKPGEFEAGAGKDGQSFEHALIACSLGVQHFIIAVNKMDEESRGAAYNESRFNEIKENVAGKFKTQVGWGSKPLFFVPISGYKGINVIQTDNSAMPWYKGKSLIETIEDLPNVSHDLSTPLRMSVSGKAKIPGVGDVTCCKVMTGKVSVGDSVVFAPYDGKAEIKTIEKFKTGHKEAFPDDSIGITFKGLKPDNLKLEKGHVVGAPNSGLQKCMRFTGLGQVLSSGNVHEIKIGFTPVISAHTARSSCQIVAFKSIKERRGAEAVEVIAERKVLKPKDVFTADFQPQGGKFVIESDPKYKMMCRFIVRNSNSTIAVGKCLEICNDKFEELVKEKKEKTEKAEGKKKKK